MQSLIGSFGDEDDQGGISGLLKAVALEQR
jgi:hypothetical protein